MTTATKQRPRSRSLTNSRQDEPRDELERFVQFCGDALTVNEGGPLVVESFQQRMLADYFAGVRSTVILISKKNGKTSLLGALALYHLLTTPDAECVIAAASRDQAAIMLRQPRMEGPQSDRDVQLYREAAGQIGDPSVPRETKKAALQTIRRLQAIYKNNPTGGVKPSEGRKRVRVDAQGNVIAD